MSIFQITLFASAVTLTETAVRAGQWPGGLSTYEQQTLAFCHQWLNGKESFGLHTSGSTGTPKPIAIKRQQMHNSARMTGKALGLQAGDRALVNLNTAYIAGVMMLVRGMELGLQLTVMEPASRPLAGFAPETRFEFFSFVPLQLQNTPTHTPDQLAILQHAKAIILGGAPVTGSLQAQMQTIRSPVFQTYGMTETVSHIALRRLNGPELSDDYTVLEGVQIAADSRNCLIIQAPALSEQTIITHDVVEILSPTTFRWLGRADNMINSGGVKVHAEQVEQAVEKVLGELRLERRFFVAGLPHSLLGEAVTLWLEGHPLEKPTEDVLRERLMQRLSRYEMPKAIHYQSFFPETPTGKIDRRALISAWGRSQINADKTPLSE